MRCYYPMSSSSSCGCVGDGPGRWGLTTTYWRLNQITLNFYLFHIDSTCSNIIFLHFPLIKVNHKASIITLRWILLSLKTRSRKNEWEAYYLTKSLVINPTQPSSTKMKRLSFRCKFVTAVPPSRSYVPWALKSNDARIFTFSYWFLLQYHHFPSMKIEDIQYKRICHFSKLPSSEI